MMSAWPPWRIADYEAHLSVIRDGAVPLPAELTELLTDLVRRLDVLAVEEPLVALKALADLRYVIAQTGQDAGYELGERDVPLPAVAAALGTSEAARKAVDSLYDLIVSADPGRPRGPRTRHSTHPWIYIHLS
ncbi:hypothetical protein [Streptomyces venezuelae]|uniref:hypothetical protein n=1 Tax=Streptomyces venezuelae TaxID=54571 RepID=UPI003327269E